MKGTHALEYKQLQRIQNQLSLHPGNKRWTLNIGGGWDVSRERDRLFLSQTQKKKKRRLSLHDKEVEKE